MAKKKKPEGIKVGDETSVAYILDCSREHVCRVLAGTRDDNIGVKTTITAIVKHREKLKEKNSKEKT